MSGYAILHSIVHDRVTYSRGERIPDGMDEATIKELYEHGIIARIDEDGNMHKYVKPVQLSDAEINKMLAWPANEVLHFVKNRIIHVESMKRIIELLKLTPPVASEIKKKIKKIEG